MAGAASKADVGIAALRNGHHFRHTFRRLRGSASLHGTPDWYRFHRVGI